MIKHRATSIQFRLTVSYMAILAFTFALVGISVWIALNHSIKVTADRELRSRLADVRRYFDGFSPDDLRHLQEEFQEESLLGQSTANIRIYDATGHWLFRTPSTERWPLEKLTVAGLPEQGDARTIRVGKEVIRVLSAPVRVGAVEIGLPIGEFEEVKQGFAWLLAVGAPLLLMLAWLAGYWLSGRALRPVDEISAAAARISESKLNERLPVQGGEDELDRLSQVLNDMLSRLESAFKRVTEFTADASHELRTPVAIIQTTAELMQSQPRTLDDHVRAWRRVTIETERTSRLIADLLTLARADAGKAELELTRLDLAEVVRTAVEEMRVIADSKGLELKVDKLVSSELAGDAEALRRSVCILLDNALKFTSRPGGITVSMDSHAVSITDTGCGIAADDLSRVFERFYRVSKDRSRQTGGTGLGLSIARWIVEQHGGAITVASAPGKGSTFTMTFPSC